MTTSLAWTSAIPIPAADASDNPAQLWAQLAVAAVPALAVVVTAAIAALSSAQSRADLATLHTLSQEGRPDVCETASDVLLRRLERMRRPMWPRLTQTLIGTVVASSAWLIYGVAAPKDTVTRTMMGLLVGGGVALVALQVFYILLPAEKTGLGRSDPVFFDVAALIICLGAAAGWIVCSVWPEWGWRLDWLPIPGGAVVAIAGVVAGLTIAHCWRRRAAKKATSQGCGAAETPHPGGAAADRVLEVVVLLTMLRRVTRQHGRPCSEPAQPDEGSKES